MHFHINTCALTYTGRRKQVNQDVLLVKSAVSEDFGSVCFALICDGLGGLSMGQVASALFAKRMERWFVEDFVLLLGRASERGRDSLFCLRGARLSWQSIIWEMNEEIAECGEAYCAQMGTTVLAFLLVGSDYLVMNVGDSRLYIQDDRGLRRGTRDHSFLERIMEAGGVNLEEALGRERRSVLSQCVGAVRLVRPDFSVGTVSDLTSVLLCTDAFWRRVSRDELLRCLQRGFELDEAKMRENLFVLIDGAKRRGEVDNISALWLCLQPSQEEETWHVPVCVAGFQSRMAAAC